MIERREYARSRLQKPRGFWGVSELEVRYFISQILNAVDYLHTDKDEGGGGCVHRDLSLKNIFLGTNKKKSQELKMQVKVGDFGMSVALEKGDN